MAGMCEGKESKPVTYVEGRIGNKQRMRLDWAARMEALTDTEFSTRYRVNKRNFRKLNGLIRKDLKGKRSDAIIPEVKIACTLRWLAGGQYLDVADIHGVEARSAFYKIVWQTVTAINDCKELNLRLIDEEDPDGGIINNIDRLAELAAEFDCKTLGKDGKTSAFAGCFGALDGLAININKPKNAPSQYYCRKGVSTCSLHLASHVSSNHLQTN